MRTHLTADEKNMVKQMSAVLISGDLTKELQPLDIGVNRTQQAQQKQRVYMQNQWSRFEQQAQRVGSV